MASFFHPTTALFALLPFQPAFALQLFLPLPFAAWGTFRLGRALGLRPWAAALAGAAYSLSGYFLSSTEFTFSSLAAAALPFVAVGALRVRGPRPRPMWLVVSFVLLLLAGDPVLDYLAVGTALCFAFKLRPMGRVVAALALAVLIAAVQLAPAVGLLAESSRAKGVVAGATFWSLGLTQVLGFVLPPEGLESNTLYRSTWLGVLTAALAVLGASTRGKARVPLLIVAVLALGFANDALPLWKAASAMLPGWKSFRFPAKCVGPFYLVVAICAGRGAQWLSRRFRLPALRVGLLVGVLAELAWINGPLLKTAPDAPAPPLARALSDLGVSLEGPTYAWRWQLPPGAPPCTACQLTSLAPASGSLFGLPTSNFYVPALSTEYSELTVRSMWLWLGESAAVFGSRYQLGTPTEDAGAVVARDEDAGVVAVELPDALPRAYVATGVLRFDHEIVPNAISQGHFVRGQEVVLAKGADGPEARKPVEPWTPATVHRDGPSVEVTATATAPSVLVLNEAYARGVRAFEGERELPVFRVNHIVRGVSLEPGQHTVRFEFQTPGLALGAALSAFGLFVLAAWRVRARQRLRR